MSQTTLDTQEKKKKYEEQREYYKNLRSELLTKIYSARQSIPELERKLEEERPKTENGEGICFRCHCVSLKFFTRSIYGTFVYDCEICGDRVESDKSTSPVYGGDRYKYPVE